MEEIIDHTIQTKRVKPRATAGQIPNKLNLTHQGILGIVTVVVFVLFAVTANGFLSMSNFFTILRSMSIVTVLAVGVTFVITLGEIDLSIQSIPGLCAAIFCVMVERDLPVYIAIVAVFMVAMLFGLVNGLIIQKTSLPSIIITLATTMIATGLTDIVTEHRAVVISNPAFVRFFAGTIWRFPTIALWMLVMVAISYFVLHRMKFGRNIAFVGANKEAARYAGMHIGSIVLTSFMLTAGFSFMAGMLGAAQASNATPGMLQQYMLTAIAATVIGGTLMSGGKSNVLGAVLGAFFLAMIENGFLISGIDQWVLYAINGLVIIGTLSWRYLSLQRQE